MKLIIRFIINVVAIWVMVQILEPVSVEGGIWSWVIVAIVFGLVNAFIRPIVKLLALPITIVTLGLFTLIINALMLIITSWVTGLTISGGILDTILYAILGSIIISIVSMILSWFLPD